MFAKSTTMKKILDLKQAIVKRIQRIVSSYCEVRVIFDRYDVTQSLKEKTREKRAKQSEQMGMKFQVHDDLIILKVY